MDLDIILGVITGGALIYGLYKGFIAQLASIGGLILGIGACRLFNQQAGDFMMSLFPNLFTSHTIAVVAGCVGLFLIVYFSISAFACLLRKMTHALCVGWADRLLGAAASVFKWLLFSSVVLNIWHYFAPESSIFISSHIMDGRLFEMTMHLAPKIFGIVSEQLSLPYC